MRRALLFLLLLFLPVACADPTPDSKPDSTSSLDERKAREREYREIVSRFNQETGARQLSVPDLMAKLRSSETVLLIDVREPDEQAVSTLRGALRQSPASVSQLDLEALRGDPDPLVVTYCTAGYRSGFAARELEERSGKPVYNLSGGLIEWFNQGGEVVDSDSKAIDRIHPFSAEWGRFVRPRAP